MAIFTFTQPGDYGSTYFTLETVRNDQGFYDLSSLKNAEGFYSNFNRVVEDHLVTSSYIFSEVIPPGTSSFEFNPLVSGMPTGSFYFRGTGNMTVNVATYSGSYTLTPAQLYGQGILNTFALTPIPDFQSRVAASGGYYQDIESQNTILNSIGTDLLSSASLVITPNAYKEDFLYSVIPSNGNGDFTVTRATTATLTNANGNVVLEPYNLLPNSNDLTQGTWVKSNASITLNSIANPLNGFVNGQTFTPNTASGLHFAFASASTAAGQSFLMSFFVKANGYTNCRIENATNSAGVWFNLSNGTITSGTGGSITALTNGWYLVSYLLTSVGAATKPLISFAPSTNLNFVGDGTSGGYVFGAQLVEGTDALPYQPTLDRLDRVRLDYSINGEPNILLEPQRTNLQPQSNGFLSDWSKEDLITSIGESTLISGQSTTLVTETAINAVHRFVPFSPVTLLIGTVYTISFYAKSNGTRNIGIRTGITGTNQNVIFNPNTQTTVSIPTGFTTKITAANNGYYRYEITATSAVLSDSCNIVMFNGTSISYLGTSESFYVSAFQYEAGAYATSYIPTTTASVTRNADSITRNNIYTNGLITAAGGTWFVEVRNNRSIFRDTFSNGIFFSGANGALQIRNTFAGRLSILKVVGGTSTNLYTTTTDTSKIAIKWNGSTADVFVNGVKEASATAFTETNMEFLIVNGIDVPKFINSMILYPTPLPDSKCIELTGGGFDTPELAYASIGVASESPTYLNQSVNSLIF